MSTGLLLDMDGVIYKENNLIPGAVELVSFLQSAGMPFVFLTNNSAPTPDDLVVKLKHLGIPNLNRRHFYTSAMNTADFLAQMHPRCTAYVIGEVGLQSALQDAGIPNDALRPSYVIVGEGNPSVEKMVRAHELIEEGARLVVTNPDNWCPVKGSITRPGAGALAAFLELSTGKRAYFLGKPNPYMFIQARRHLAVKVDEVLMVGDTMETDIRGGVELGLQTCLVLSGSTQLRDLTEYVYQPTMVMNSVADLLEHLKSGGTSDRMCSPAFTHGENPLAEKGPKYSVDDHLQNYRKFRAPMTR